MTPTYQRIFAAAARGDGHNGLGIAGDCMRAALASLLDLPYADVPHVSNYADEDVALQHTDQDDPTGIIDKHGPRWYRRTRRWLRNSYGLDYASLSDEPLDHALNDWPLIIPGTVDVAEDLTIPWPCNAGDPWQGHVIAAGYSPRGDWGHVVVAYYDGHAPPGERLTIVHDPHPSGRGIKDGPAGVYALDLVVPAFPPDPPTVEEDPLP